MSEKIEPILKTAQFMFLERIKDNLVNALEAAKLDCETIPLQLEVIEQKLENLK